MSSAAVVIGALRLKRPHMKIAEFVNFCASRVNIYKATERDLCGDQAVEKEVSCLLIASLSL